MAYQQNLDYFDFGRTSSDHHGLIEFKKNWGADETDISHFRFTKKSKPALLFNREINLKSNRILKITPKLPVSLLKFIGNCIYKHMG